VRRHYPLSSPEVAEMQALMATVRTSYVHITTAQWDLELRR
jgi:hypothetical protein